jgi:hypothetical protein
MALDIAAGGIANLDFEERRYERNCNYARVEEHIEDYNCG